MEAGPQDSRSEKRLMAGAQDSPSPRRDIKYVLLAVVLMLVFGIIEWKDIQRRVRFDVVGLYAAACAMGVGHTGLLEAPAVVLNR